MTYVPGSFDDADHSAAPMLVSYEVSDGVYTLSRVGVNEITENDTATDKKGDYATNGYDAYVTVSGGKTDGSMNPPALYSLSTRAITVRMLTTR